LSPTIATAAALRTRPARTAYGPNDGSASTITDVAATDVTTNPSAATRLGGIRPAGTGQR
jgi:hypothetical protein